MTQFAGKYLRTKEEKYDDFLYALGLNFFLRKAATVSVPSMEITDLGNGNIPTYFNIGAFFYIKPLFCPFRQVADLDLDHSEEPRLHV